MKKEINFVDFYTLIYLKRYYVLLSIILGLFIAYSYFFVFNQKLYKSNIYIYHYTDIDYQKWALNNSKFFNEYFFFRENDVEATIGDVIAKDVFFEFTRLIDTNDLLIKYLIKYKFNLQEIFINEINAENQYEYLRKLVKFIKIKNFIENKEMFIEVKSIYRDDVVNIFNLLKVIRNILYFEKENLTLSEYDHNYSLFAYRAMEKYFEDQDYSSEKTEEYLEWTKTFNSNKVNTLVRGEFDLLYFDLNENEIRYVNSVSFIIISLISVSSCFILFLFYFLLTSAISQRSND